MSFDFDGMMLVLSSASHPNSRMIMGSLEIPVMLGTHGNSTAHLSNFTLLARFQLEGVCVRARRGSAGASFLHMSRDGDLTLAVLQDVGLSQLTVSSL